jgi:hypothetical protein
MSDKQFKIDWIDRGREPQSAPDPAYPKGRDIDMSTWCVDGWPSCKADLPYPAKRCGTYIVECKLCGMIGAVTTAGRPDDPRSVRMGCKKPEGTLQ